MDGFFYQTYKEKLVGGDSSFLDFGDLDLIFKVASP